MDNWSYLAAGKGDILLPPTLDRRRKQDQSPSGGRTSHAVTVYRRKGVYAGRFAHSGMPCTTAVFRRDQAPSLRAQGYSWREIAGRLGTSVASVRRACQTPNVSSLGVAKTPKHILAPCCDTAVLLGEWRSKRCSPQGEQCHPCRAACPILPDGHGRVDVHKPAYANGLDGVKMGIVRMVAA